MISLNENSASVYVIILNWNHKDDLIETIESFNKQDYLNLTLVISDNGSTDDSIDTVKKKFTDIVVIENNENLGWAAGNNVGIQYALDNNAEYILLANNDLYIENKRVLSTLVSNIEQLKNKNVRIIGAKVNYYKPKEKLHNNGWIMFLKFENNGRFINVFRKNFNKNISENFRVVDYVSGCFMLINSELFKKIGLIDESFFIYAEEAEFSYRAWMAGYASVINKDITIYHKVSATNKIGSPFSMYLRTRNLNYFLKKHKKTIPNYYFYKRKYFIEVIKQLINIILFPTRFEGKRYEVFRATCMGLYHGILNKNLGNKL